MRFLVVVLAACSSQTPTTTSSSSPPAPPAPPASSIPAGPLPVTLATLAPSQVRTLNEAKGYVVIDRAGARRWGHPIAGSAPYEGPTLERGDSAYGHLFMEGGADRTWFHSENEVRQDLDSYAALTRASATDVVLLVDAATPARVALREGIQSFGYQKLALAAGAANTAALYEFGGEPWTPWGERADLTLRVDRLADLAGQHPRSVLLEITDTSTTGELIAALGALGDAGVERVRIHRLMGWGDIPVTDILWVEGPVADDDRITDDDPAQVEVAEPSVRGELSVMGVHTALMSYAPRFRYCFEKRGKPKLRGRMSLAFDVGPDGAITNATAKGVDPKIASCVAGAVFDLDISPEAIHGAGHASAAIAFNTEAPATTPAEPEPTGFWCWTADDVGLCARQQAQCEAARSGFDQGNAAFGEALRAAPCTAQPRAWTRDGKHFAPSNKVCGGGCRQVR